MLTFLVFFPVEELTRAELTFRESRGVFLGEGVVIFPAGVSLFRLNLARPEPFFRKGRALTGVTSVSPAPPSSWSFSANNCWKVRPPPVTGLSSGLRPGSPPPRSAPSHPRRQGQQEPQEDETSPGHSCHPVVELSSYLYKVRTCHEDMRSLLHDTFLVK